MSRGLYLRAGDGLAEVACLWVDSMSRWSFPLDCLWEVTALLDLPLLLAAAASGGGQHGRGQNLEQATGLIRVSTCHRGVGLVIITHSKTSL